MEPRGPLAFLFSPENRPWTLAIIVAVAALATFLVLDRDDGGSGTESTTAASVSTLPESSDVTAGPDEGTIATLPASLTADECLSSAAALSLAASGGFGQTGQIDQTRIDEAFERMSAVAPADIADDLAIIAAGLREFFSILEDENLDLDDPTALAAPEAAAAFERAGAALESAGFAEAAENVDAWFESACGELTGS